MSRPTPLVIKELESRLVSAGFDAEHTETPERFGNELLVFSGSGLLIRAVCDRDEWSLELSAEGALEDWFVLDVWRACIERREPSIDPLPLEDDVAFLAANLDVLVRLRDSDEWERFVGCLYDAQEARGRLMHEALFGEGGGSS